MKGYIFANNLKLIYKHSESELTSICISVDAGAGIENNKKGIAHAVEHMVYKSTRNRTEAQINEELSSIFGFQNAMTNYPYVIYYGSLLNEDLEKGIELFSDILLNPIFDQQGFKDEMEVIKEELEEWDQEVEQFCEDKLFLNIFDKSRIKYPIIGTQESLDKLTVNDIKDFYQENYFPENTSVAIVSSIAFDKIIEILEKYFGIWKSKSPRKINEFNYCEHKNIDVNNIFYEKRDGVKNARVEIVFPLDKLNDKELSAFKIFNQYFGEGVNSMLFDTLRTKNSLVYDVITRVAHEKYLKMYKITFTTSKENVEKAVNLVNKLVEDINSGDISINDVQLEKLIKSYKLKKLFREEQSVVLAKELATYDSMFGDYNIYAEEISIIDEITINDMFDSAKKVLDSSAVQVIH